MNTPFDIELLSISPAQIRDVSVEYYKTIERTIGLTNLSPDVPLLIEEVATYCPADAADVSLMTRVKCGFELEPNQGKDVTISITPNALYKESTNLLDVRVKFRVHGTTISETKERTVRGSMSIIVDEPKESLGKIFISFKQDEDRSLARTLAKIAKRAGFTPFLKAEHPRPGEDQWEDIKKQLQASLAVLVIWTDYTGLRDGVKTEVEFCHANAIYDILLLGDEVDRPPIYAQESRQYKEYTRFDRQSPSVKFAEVIESLRNEPPDRGR
jgi:hypothetical protein